jgi:uncharacterized membrane protein
VSETPTPTPPPTPGGTVDEGRLFAFLAYFLGIIGFIIVFAVKKDNKFAMFHAKQSLVLFIVAVANGIIWQVPLIGWIAGAVIGLAVFVFWIMGIINALGGQEKALPIIGDLAAKINL